MKKTLTTLSLTMLFTIQTPLLHASEHESHAHWGYSGKTGPAHWGSLKESFNTCSAGKNQSPINLTRMIEGDLSPLNTQYKTAGFQVINNGHTIQVNYKQGSQLTISGHTYQLKQFHFHNPSENTINGQHFPLEAHLVHADKKGNLAVIAIMFKEGKENPVLAKVWAKMPKEAGHQATLPNPVNVQNLLPNSNDYYRFNGSLTTPPCSEGVAWFVMKQPVTASKAQINAFKAIMGHPNNRPVQPINARILVK